MTGECYRVKKEECRQVGVLGLKRSFRQVGAFGLKDNIVDLGLNVKIVDRGGFFSFERDDCIQVGVIEL